MKRSLFLAATLVLSAVGSQTAEAQYRRRPAPVVTMQVSSWSPQTGAAGTIVTLSGSGFTRRTQVLIGGYKVRPTRMGATSITFRVPKNYGDGRIILRKVGSANDYVVGNFQVWANPQLVGFAPASGTAGTRVTLRGRDLSGVKRVTLGTLPLQIEQYSPNGIGLVVTIPQGAATGYFSVYDKRNTVSRSRRAFQVVAPAPYISGFSPTHGQPGSIVRVNGGNYGDDIRVTYGRSPMRIVRTGNGWLEVEIPPRANRSDLIQIISRRGGARSAGVFSLEQPAWLGNYSSSWGLPGARVQLNGRNFMAGDRVTLGGQPCKIIQLQDGRITVEIPNNAHSGVFAIQRGPQVIRSNSQFDVVYNPQISNVAPWQGAPGTVVNVTGTNLMGSKFYLGNTPIRPTWIKPNQMQFVIPRRSVGGNLRVVSRGGEATYGKSIRVWNFPGIKRVSPARGGYGSQVTIVGSQLANADKIMLGGMVMPIVSRGADRVVVTVPRGAQSGPISWSAYGQAKPTRWNFTVVRAPVLRSYSPREGGPGTQVTISGEGFDRNTQVFYGRIPVRVSRWDARNLNIVIPSNAGKSDYLSIQGEGGGMAAPRPFGYLAAPLLNSYWPAQGKPGTELTLRGTALTTDTLVKVGNQQARMIRVNRDGTVTVAVPQNLAAGNYEVSVQWRGMRSVSRKSFRVNGWAQVYDIRPRIARIGQKIMLSGSDLRGARIYYGQWELPVVKTDPRGRRVWVTIPKECSGSSVLTIDDNGHRTNTSLALEIFTPPAVDIRDHRRPKDIIRQPRPRYPRRGRRRR